MLQGGLKSGQRYPFQFSMELEANGDNDVQKAKANLYASNEAALLGRSHQPNFDNIIAHALTDGLSAWSKLT